MSHLVSNARLLDPASLTVLCCTVLRGITPYIQYHIHVLSDFDCVPCTRNPIDATMAACAVRGAWCGCGRRGAHDAGLCLPLRFTPSPVHDNVKCIWLPVPAFPARGQTILYRN
jgi:hypothetical protein